MTARRQPTAGDVLVAIRSGLATPDAARAELLGHPAPDTRTALNDGRWVRAGQMEVRLA